MNHTRRRHLGLAFACMLAPDKGGESGNSGKTLEEKLNDALADRDKATSQVTDLTKERDKAQKDLQDSQAEVKRVTDQFDALTKTADAAKADVTRLTGELSSMTSERDTLKGKLTTADTNVTRLEKLCGLNGVDPASAVPTESSEGAKGGLLDKFLKATATEKAAMVKKDGPALYAEAEARGIRIG